MADHQLSDGARDAMLNDEVQRSRLVALIASSARALQRPSTLPAEKTKLRERIFAVTADYVSALRVSQCTPEAMLVDIKRVVTESSAALDPEVRRRFSEELVALSIEAYYSACA